MSVASNFKQFHGDKQSAANTANVKDVTVLQINKARKGCFVVLYTIGPNERLCVEFWTSNRKQTPDRYAYRDNEHRMRAVRSWINRNIRHYSQVSKRNTVERGLEVGDVLSAAWGYDQTNYNYYQVTKLVGKTMVEIRELGAMSVETEFLQGKSTPEVDKFIGEPMRRVAKDGRVKVSDVIRASKMKYTTVAGARIYDANHWTAYH